MASKLQTTAMRALLIFASSCGLTAAMPTDAAETLTGKVLQAQGHQNSACRMLLFRENGASRQVWLRIPNTGSDNSIIAVAMTALTSELSVVSTTALPSLPGAGLNLPSCASAK